MSRAKTRRTRGVGEASSADLLRDQPPAFSAWHVDEPALRFCGDHPCPDPKTGLSLFGPFDGAARPVIRVGLVGTGATVDRALRFLDRLSGPISPVARAHGSSGKLRFPDAMLYPDFPGMGSGSQFSTELVNLTPELLTEADLLSVRRASADRAIEEMARRIGERLDVLRGRESRPDVVVVSLPREFETAMRRTGGTPKRRRRDPQIEKALRSLAADRRARQGHLFDLAPTIGRDGASSPPASLHRALKIEAMRMRVPVQVVWESTLSADGGKQDDATIAWNLAVGLYYKAGGVPWRLSGIDEDTCYVGVAFFRPTGMSSTLGCSVAQAFSQHGDGIVLRGDPFQWTAYGPPDLGREASRKLLASVLDMYASSTRRKPKRVVIHKSSRVTDAEYAGFVEALGDIPFHDFLALKTSDLRFLRTGREPPLRGTVVCLDEAIGRAVVYTRGYIPFLGIYPGQRVPLPIEICEQRGNGSLRQVTSELLALTKMNWNSADFACAEPITLAFARNVGHILADFPSGETPEPSYRYYM